MSGYDSSDDDYDDGGLELSEDEDVVDETQQMISAMIRDGKSILERTQQHTTSGGESSYTFGNPIDRMIGLEDHDDDEDSQSSYTTSNNNNYYYNRATMVDERQSSLSSLLMPSNHNNLNERQNLTTGSLSSLIGIPNNLNTHSTTNGITNNNSAMNVTTTSDHEEEDDSSEMDESDTTEEEEEFEEMEDEEDVEEPINLREWQICYPINACTLYTSTNSYPPVVTASTDKSEHDDLETIFSFMPINQKLFELIELESPIIDYSYVLQTRSDDPTPYIPENLYTSLVYQFHQTVLFHEKIRKRYEKIIAEIKLAFRDTGEEVHKIVQIVEVNQTRVPANLIPEKQGGNPKDVIMGDIKGLELMKPLSQREDPNSVMENRTKFNIDVVSAHYKNRAFTIQIRYYFPEEYSEDDLPFCIVQGAPFLTSARRKKPQRTAESKKRRKIQRLIDIKRDFLQQLHGPNAFIQAPVLQVSQPTVSTLENFIEGLKEIIYFIALLPQEDKQRAVEMALRTLVQNDKDI